MASAASMTRSTRRRSSSSWVRSSSFALTTCRCSRVNAVSASVSAARAPGRMVATCGRRQRVVHRVEQFGGVAGLGDDAGHAERVGDRPRLRLEVVGGVEHHGDRLGARVGPDLADEFVAVHARHQDVGDHQVRGGSGAACSSACSAPSASMGVVPVVAEHRADQVAVASRGRRPRERWPCVSPADCRSVRPTGPAGRSGSIGLVITARAGSGSAEAAVVRQRQGERYAVGQLGHPLQSRSAGCGRGRAAARSRRARGPGRPAVASSRACPTVSTATSR